MPTSSHHFMNVIFTPLERHQTLSAIPYTKVSPTMSACFSFKRDILICSCDKNIS